MALPFIDTNVILRHITQDNPDYSARALQFFQELETGDRTATSTEGVLVEAVQVLSSRTLYHLLRGDIQAKLRPIIVLKGLKLAHKRVYLRALDIYATTNLDFVDALLVAHSERSGNRTIISFDRDFDRIPGVHREEP